MSEDITVSEDANGKTIVVAKDSSGDYSIVQDAIDAAEDGDTIRVYEGTYNENVIVDKTISLIGNGSEVTLIHAMNEHLDIMKLRANWVNVTGFTMAGGRSGSAGIKVEFDYNMISENNCSDNNYGIYLESSHQCTIISNSCSNNSRGIYLVDSKNNTITNNTLNQNAQMGIRFYYSHNNLISNNTANSNDHNGIFLESSNANIISNNVAHSNLFAGISLDSSTECTLQNNRCNSTRAGSGIFLSESNFCVLIGNICSNNSEGIGLGKSNNCTLNSNLCTNNGGNGISLSMVDDCIIMNNTCFNNNDGRGIFLSSSNRCVIIFNLISGNEIGVYLRSSSQNNTARYNNIVSNTEFGIDARSNDGYSILAISNWWNDISGPFHPSNNNEGKGDIVTDYVMFDPWLMEPNTFSSMAILDNITPSPATEGEEIRFEGRGLTTDSIMGYAWRSSIDGEFYNGTKNETGNNAISNGSHTIYLKVQEDSGIWSEEVSVILIVNGIPRAHIDLISPNPAIEGKTVTFNGHGTDDGSITGYAWRSSIDEEIFNGTELEIEYDQLSNGTHIIFFKVQDDIGKWSDEVSVSLIVNGKPRAYIDVIAPDPAMTSQTIQFSGRGTDDGSIQRYAWRTNDTELYNGSNSDFSTSGLSSGTYWIFFKVQDDLGIWSDNVIQTLIVHERPLAEITSITPNPALNTDTISFNGIGTDDGSIQRYVWSTEIMELHNDTYAAFSHSAFSPGTYTIYLKVQDNYGVWSDEVSEGLIIHERPVASIDSIAPNPGQLNEHIHFLGVGVDDGSIERYAWRTNDSELYNGIDADFTLSTLPVGTHTVYLKVQDDYGVWSNEVSTTLIIHGRPVATIESILPNPALETATVTFSCSGTDDGEIMRYAWRTESEELYNGTDAEFSTSDLAPGVYTIYLMVQDNYGVWSEEVSQEVEILADSDQDGIADIDDAFPNDPAASKDTDGDGYPDEWNNGKTEDDSTTGLKLDLYPGDSKKWEKKNDDGGFIPGFELMILIVSIAIAVMIDRRD